MCRSRHPNPNPNPNPDPNPDPDPNPNPNPNLNPNHYTGTLAAGASAAGVWWCWWLGVGAMVALGSARVCRPMSMCYMWQYTPPDHIPIDMWQYSTELSSLIRTPLAENAFGLFGGYFYYYGYFRHKCCQTPERRGSGHP